MKTSMVQYRSGDGWQSKLPEADSAQTLVLVFGAPEFMHDSSSLQQVADSFPSSHVIGCSTAGEIFEDEIFDHSLSVSITQFEHSQLKSAWSTVSTSASSFAAGQSIARQLAAPDLQAVIVLSDGLQVNGTELVSGINAELPAGVVVTGGLAGDGPRFENTWILQNGAPVSGKICAVGLYGDRLRIGHGSQGGWDFFGPERVITRAEGNVLYEVDGRPALDLYIDYLGERASELPAAALLFPLSIRASRDTDERVVRTILSIDEAARSMTFAGDLPEGHLAQLMRANLDRLIDGAGAASQDTIALTKRSEPGLMIAISCVGRRLVLGERTEEEVEATMELMPAGSHQVGFYSYGELSPIASGRCDLHNQTMTLTGIWEI
ncbi:MAG: FIST N-terminal domain-containing protein [Myxococcota bacterium]|nr:FIST N-terminal domain-containing protein [Myxococcota bacterium]